MLAPTKNEFLILYFCLVTQNKYIQDTFFLENDSEVLISENEKKMYA